MTCQVELTICVIESRSSMKLMDEGVESVFKLWFNGIVGFGCQSFQFDAWIKRLAMSYVNLMDE